ncbi:MAG: hypothetical protein ABIR79_18590 [Candidatus Binatia bacterium]
MAKRARKRGAATTWWTVGALVAVAVLLAWWLSARRAEAPGLPASIPGARALSESPDEHEAAHDGAHDEITDDEKQGLEKVLREHNGAAPGK